MTQWRTCTVLVSLLSLGACTVGPNYKRPAVTVPAEYRGVAPDASKRPAGEDFAEMKWWAVFQDDTLLIQPDEAVGQEVGNFAIQKGHVFDGVAELVSQAGQAYSVRNQTALAFAYRPVTPGTDDRMLLVFGNRVWTAFQHGNCLCRDSASTGQIGQGTLAGCPDIRGICPPQRSAAGIKRSTKCLRVICSRSKTNLRHALEWMYSYG